MRHTKKRTNRFVLLLPLLLLNVLGVHKYYVSLTEINYVSQKASLQITTRIFVDDFERLLRERYDKTIELTKHNESPKANTYIKQYLKKKITLTINGQPVMLNFIGKTYDYDIVRCYLEVENVTRIESITISNRVLFDVFENQKNIIKTNINSKQNSYILENQNDTASLNFN